MTDVGTAPKPTTAQGICIAFLDPWNVTNATSGATQATWTRIDDPSTASLSIGGDLITSPSHVVTSWSSDRGRQYELDTTQTGTATISITDTSGLFNPVGSSPYVFGLGAMKRCVINAQNPVTGVYSDVFSGYVQTYTWKYADQSKSVMLIDISLVDGFDQLTRSELVPDNTGYTTFNGGQVDDRINALLFSGDWPGIGTADSLASINSGNVACAAYQYNSGTTVLSAIQDAADAEFPGVANFFIDRHGNATFRGRWPRFIPEDYSPSQVSFWNVGDYDYAETFGYAPFSDIEWTIDQTLQYNACLCYPYNFPQYNYPAQLKFDPISIAAYGTRQITLNDIIVHGAAEDTDPSHAPTTGPPLPATDGPTECQAFASYYVDNFAYSTLRISSITFKTVDPNGGTPNAALWEMLLNVEIGDVLNVYTTIPGGGGLDPTTTIPYPDGSPNYQGNQFFVDGIHHQVNPLNAEYPDWTVTLDLSPRAWYKYFKSNTYYAAP